MVASLDGKVACELSKHLYGVVRGRPMVGFAQEEGINFDRVFV
jgi:hypothetical protein